MKEAREGVPESGNRSKRHPPQYQAQPAIGASRMAKMSEMHNYLGVAKAKYKQQEEELRVIRQRMAGLQSRLCNWRVEKAYLLRVKTKITKLLDEAKRIDRELDLRIRDLKEQCKQAKSDVEEKKTLLGALHPSINAIEQNIATYNNSLISLHEDPCEEASAAEDMWDGEVTRQTALAFCLLSLDNDARLCSPLHLPFSFIVKARGGVMCCRVGRNRNYRARYRCH
ncbi:hypothetical protein TSMEX_010642 [Taenia solium]|eukprot:TsM_000465900 transcript=TsM_000465900 gene=TsM_000465900